MTELLETLIQAAVALLPTQKNFSVTSTTDNETQKLDSTLSKLISQTSVLNLTARLDPRNSALLQFLNTATELLGRLDVRPITRSKILLVFSNLYYYNVPLRKRAANNHRMCQVIHQCLELAIQEQLGPQNKIDILRLLQMITYENIEFGPWVDNFVPFLMAEILNDAPTELLPYCMCILSNLVSQSRNFTAKIKQKDFFKCLCSRVLQLLSHNSKAIVVSSLVLVGYLDEKTRDIVYSSQNLSQTFLCIFNILGTSSPDVLMTTHISVDLLRRLIVRQPKTPSDSPTLNQTARNLTSYSFFEKSIQKVASLLNVLDPRAEEARKILSLLLSFLQIDELRHPVCLAIAAIEPSEAKLCTPCHTLLRIARLSFEEVIFPEVPLTALQLLTFIIKAAINAGQSVRRLFSPINPLLSLIKEILADSKIDTDSPLAPSQASKIAEGLRMAEAISNDEDVRFDLLEWVSAGHCSAIFEQQMSANPVGYTIASLTTAAPICQILDHCEEEIASTSKETNLPLWSVNAVSIPIQLMRLLASFKDYSKPHKELYWRSLKDSRLLPFLAYGIARGDHELIYDAFVLLTHCAQVHEFPLKTLSKLTLIWASLRKIKIKNRKQKEGKLADQSYENPLSDGAVMRDHQERTGEMTRLIAALQSKLAGKEEREWEELEEELTNRDDYSQNAQHRHIANGHGGPMRKRNEHEPEEFQMAIHCQLKKALETEKMKFVLAEERNKELEVENEKERELHSILRGKFDDMMRKFDTAARVAFEKQVELEKISSTSRRQEARMREAENALQEKVAEMERAEKQIAEQKVRLETQAAELEEVRAQNQKLMELKMAMTRLLD